MTTTLSIDGMSCEHCEQTVSEALESVAGVTGVVVDHEAGTATVEGDADEGDLVAAVTDTGYDASA
ncbi:MAG: copper chaperone [Haloarculaceae archaeon]|jgi:copper chaperone